MSTPEETVPAADHLDRRSARGRAVLAGLVLGTGVAILDGSVVTVALRTIGTDLGASLAQLQWVVAGYLLALASLVLVGGALGDRWGRRRVYLVGVTWFATASALCALAASPAQLVGLRVLQGVGAALLTPGALAIIRSSFRPEDRGPAVGTWAGYSGVAAALGPLVGGWLVDHASWRWVFGINVPLCLAVLALTARTAPESRDPQARERPFDLLGGVLAALSLGALTYVLTARAPTPAGVSAGGWALAVGAGVGFVVVERRSSHPLVPLSLFASRVFSAANAMTLLVYGALGVVTLFVVLELQVAGWSALTAGLSSLPLTVAMMLLSSRSAALAERVGPRLPMTVGPALCAAGALLLLRVGPAAGWLDVLPGMVVFALGLATLVSPLTATVLAAAPDRHAGVASGVNNAVARAGSLVAVAALPGLVGLAGTDYLDPDAMTSGYRAAMLWCAALLLAGAVVSRVGLSAGERR
ncbi:MFS transporter [Phycicoccus endophyticus]|uniref:MFS transporter n=1 Tax=Phycicoccus endophyticus TaxID=1690220 RepID=A0A7G9R1G7_9MICO|nr:MFS transporter [Phycicoccus endophyticus]NHI18770.1 MFS transporter [Phycicoccus endophyticus]QNN49442.1 MFS transporter [Phycicoccus endophyticus]GGL36705.1 MFS transporter [Phycicoccus endophyticus]